MHINNHSTQSHDNSCFEVQKEFEQECRGNNPEGAIRKIHEFCNLKDAQGEPFYIFSQPMTKMSGKQSFASLGMAILARYGRSEHVCTMVDIISSYGIYAGNDINFTLEASLTKFMKEGNDKAGCHRIAMKMHSMGEHDRLDATWRYFVEKACASDNVDFFMYIMKDFPFYPTANGATEDIAESLNTAMASAVKDSPVRILSLLLSRTDQQDNEPLNENQGKAKIHPEKYIPAFNPDSHEFKMALFASRNHHLMDAYIKSPYVARHNLASKNLFLIFSTACQTGNEYNMDLALGLDSEGTLGGQFYIGKLLHDACYNGHHGIVRKLMTSFEFINVPFIEQHVHPRQGGIFIAEAIDLFFETKRAEAVIQAIQDVRPDTGTNDPGNKLNQTSSSNRKKHTI